MSLAFYYIYDAKEGIGAEPISDTFISMNVMEEMWGSNYEHFQSMLSNASNESQKFFIDMERVQDLLVSATHAVNSILKEKGDPKCENIDLLIIAADNLFGKMKDKIFEITSGDQNKMNELFEPLNNEYSLTYFDDEGNEVHGQWDPLKKGDSFTKFYYFNIKSNISGYKEEYHDALIQEAHGSVEILQWMFGVLEAHYQGIADIQDDQIKVVNLFGQCYKSLRDNQQIMVPFDDEPAF